MEHLFFVAITCYILISPIPITIAQQCTTFNSVSAGECDLGKPNFVLLYVDDLRYMLDSDPYHEVAMPFLKSLIDERAIHFENAACPMPLCTPSRVAFMTGRRVAQTKSRRYESDFKQAFSTVPGLLHKNGYETYAFGKIFDKESFGNKRNSNLNNIDICGENQRPGGECSFTASYGRDRCCCCAALGVGATNSKGMKYSNSVHYDTCQYVSAGGIKRDYDEEAIPIPHQRCYRFANSVKEKTQKFLLYRGGNTIDQGDYGIATCAVKKIKQLASADTFKPFFVAIGFNLPHIPLTSPEEHWAVFDDQDQFDFKKNVSYWTDTFSSKLPNALRPTFTESRSKVNSIGESNMSSVTGTSYQRLTKGNFFPKFRHAYYAAVRFIDDTIKYVVEELDTNDVQTKNNTHIIITSDNGYYLGEYRRIGKWSVTEATVRVPLSIIPSNNLKNLFPSIQVGTKVNSPVDHIDVFPTLLDMAGMPNLYKVAPIAGDKLPGVSLAPYFSDPNTYTRSLSVSEFPAWKGGGNSVSLRSKYFRYIRFTGSVKSRLLFDYRGGDKHRMVERKNVAGDPRYRKVRKWFDQIWKSASSKRDTKAWTLLKNTKPFDHDWQDERAFIGSF